MRRIFGLAVLIALLPACIPQQNTRPTASTPSNPGPSSGGTVGSTSGGTSSGYDSPLYSGHIAATTPGMLALGWSHIFSGDYSMACTPDITSGLQNVATTVNYKSTNGATVNVWFIGMGTADVNCIAAGDDAANSDLRHARYALSVVPLQSPTGATLTWNTPFGDTNYTPVCSAIALGTSLPATVHLISKSANAISVHVHYSVNDATPVTIECVAVPDATATSVHHARMTATRDVTGQLQASLTWVPPFYSAEYNAVCGILSPMDFGDQTIAPSIVGKDPSANTIDVRLSSASLAGSYELGCVGVQR